MDHYTKIMLVFTLLAAISVGPALFYQDTGGLSRLYVLARLHVCRIKDRKNQENPKYQNV